MNCISYLFIRFMNKKKIKKSNKNRRNIFHRDIKSANLFLQRDHKHMKLGDLNVAKVVSKLDIFA